MSINESGAVAAGKSLAQITLPTIDAGVLRLGDLRGKQVLLFCWASW